MNTVDEVGQTALHILLNHAHHNPPAQVIETLNTLLAQSTLNLSAVDEKGVFPLAAVVSLPDGPLAITLLERLADRGVWWEQTDSKSKTGETALDKAVKRDKVGTFYGPDSFRRRTSLQCRCHSGVHDKKRLTP